jgi:hypothetical protein
MEDDVSARDHGGDGIIVADIKFMKFDSGTHFVQVLSSSGQEVIDDLDPTISRSEEHPDQRRPDKPGASRYDIAFH